MYMYMYIHMYACTFLLAINTHTDCELLAFGLALMMLLAPCMSLVSTSILYRSMDTLPSGNWLEFVDLATF